MTDVVRPDPMGDALRPQELRARIERAETMDEIKPVIVDTKSLETRIRRIFGSKSREANRAARVRLEAERKAGRLLHDDERYGNGKHGKSSLIVRELGIDGNDAWFWQRLASIPDDRWKARCDELEASAKWLTRAELIGLEKTIRGENAHAARAGDPLPDGAEILYGDARDVLADVTDADLILTDPPYGDDSRHLYSWLGEWAPTALKPGGSMIVMTGQSRLDDDIVRLASGGMRYWWTIAQPNTKNPRIAGKFVINGWKPLLWYVNGFRAGRDLVADLISSTPPDKEKHPWAQGDSIAPLINRLCPPGGLVVDPFAGSWRWAELATGMGRRWLGADLAPAGTTEIR